MLASLGDDATPRSSEELAARSVPVDETPEGVREAERLQTIPRRVQWMQDGYLSSHYQK